MSRGGFSFGNVQLYQLRKYYRSWIERTLLTAQNLPMSYRDKRNILTMLDNTDPPAIEDPGLLPCASFQKVGKLSRRDDKVVCLLVIIRNLIQVWWDCSKEHPERVESSLIELDGVIENWKREEVSGSIKTGFRLEIK